MCVCRANPTEKYVSSAKPVESVHTVSVRHPAIAAVGLENRDLRAAVLTTATNLSAAPTTTWESAKCLRHAVSPVGPMDGVQTAHIATARFVCPLRKTGQRAPTM